MNKKELIERIRSEELEIRKMMFQQYLPSHIFNSLREDIKWYNDYIRYIEKNMDDEKRN
jgi:hypothetical protein